MSIWQSKWIYKAIKIPNARQMSQKLRGRIIPYSDLFIERKGVKITGSLKKMVRLKCNYQVEYKVESKKWTGFSPSSYTEIPV